MVPRLGSIGSNLWELAVLQTGNQCFQYGEASVPMFGNRYPRLGSIDSNVWEPAVFRTWKPCANDFHPLEIISLQNLFFKVWFMSHIFLVFDAGIVRTYHFFEPTHFFNI